MHIDVWCKSDRGLRRESNQDSFLVNQDLGLYIVADGMGGHSGGEVASSMAVETAENVVRQAQTLNSTENNSENFFSKLDPRALVIQIYEESSRRIFDKAANESPELLGMGTTMVSILHRNNSLFIGNVGDSRAYLFRKPHLWQLTEDHSLINEQIRSGAMKEDQAKQLVGKNVITRSVGYERDVLVDVLERPIKSGDHILLCSDGLSGLVPDSKIAEIISKTPPDKVVEKCIEEALARGGDDNVTVLFLKVN